MKYLTFLIIVMFFFSSSLFAKRVDIVAGGFNSCKLFYKDRNKKSNDKGFLKYGPTPVRTNMYKVFMRGSKNPEHYFISCFTGLVGAEKLYYINSDQPYDVREVAVHKYVNIIESYLEKHKSEGIDRARIIGHSHGGWLSMTLASALRKSIHIDTLTTIDPISFNSCTRTTIIQKQLERLGQILSWPFVYARMIQNCAKELREEKEITKREAKKKCREIFKERGVSSNLKKYIQKLYNDPSDSCLRAPWEIDDEIIQSSVDYWINYYQEKSFYLHSSVYEKADENIFKDKSHIGIDTDQGIWNRYFRD